MTDLAHDTHEGRVIPFPQPAAGDAPAPQPSTELERAILDAEIVDDSADTRRGFRQVARQPGSELVRRVPGTLVRRVDPERAMRVGKAVVRHGRRVYKGHVVWGARAWHAFTLATYDEQIRAARADNDLERLAQWIDRKHVARQARHQRISHLPATVWGAAKVAGLTLGGLLIVVTVVVPVILALAHGTSFADYYAGLHDALRTAVDVATIATDVVTSLPVVIAALLAWLLAASFAGRHAATPRWLAAPADGDEGREVIPTDSAILEALRHMGIGKLDQAFKNGWGTVGYSAQVFEQGTARDGKGYRCRIRLPQGVTVEMLNKRKDVLAHNLVRLPVEVWPTEPKDRPGVLDLWIADQGALTGPVPPWPLLADLDNASADYFKGVPVGVNIRGDVVRGLLFETNYAAAGIMGSGKSTLVITLLLGALLDPLVDADVFVMAENADYEALRPRLRSLITGSGESTVSAAMAALREAYSDLEVRGKALQEHDQRAVTRALAEKDARLRPRIVVVDETQALFMDEKHGEEAADLAVKLISAARKYAITLVFLTPEPSSTSLPRRVMAVIRCKACFAIGDQQSNDAILGTGSYKSGISSVDLDPKTDEGPGDIGTAMTRGFMAKPGLLRSYYVNQADAHRVTARAVQIRKGAGVAALPAVEPVAARDFLADLDEVLGGEVRVRTDTVRRRLTNLHEGTYGKWTAQDLTAALEDVGLRARKSNGVMVVRAVDVADALDSREVDAEDVDD